MALAERVRRLECVWGVEGGTLEIHATEAWPACEGSGYVHCSDPEHGPNCGVTFSHTLRPGVHLVRVCVGAGCLG